MILSYHIAFSKVFDYRKVKNRTFITFLRKIVKDFEVEEKFFLKGGSDNDDILNHALNPKKGVHFYYHGRNGFQHSREVLHDYKWSGSTGNGIFQVDMDGSDDK